MPGSLPQRRPNCRGFQCVCTFSRVFDHVKPPKNARIVKKKIKKIKNPNEDNRALRLSGSGPNKRSRFNRVLAPSVLGP